MHSIYLEIQLKRGAVRHAHVLCTFFTVTHTLAFVGHYRQAAGFYADLLNAVLMALPVVLFLHAFVISCLSLLLPLISACLWLSLSPPSSVFLLSSLAFHCSLKYFFPLHTLLLSLTLAESPPPLSFSLLHHFSSAFDLYLSFPLLSFSFFSLFLDKKQQVKVKDVNSNTTRYAKKTLSTLRFFYFYLKHFGFFFIFLFTFFFYSGCYCRSAA